jgi:hypothetical protein
MRQPISFCIPLLPPAASNTRGLANSFTYEPKARIAVRRPSAKRNTKNMRSNIIRLILLGTVAMAALPAQTPQTTRVEETNPSVTYSGTWTPQTDAMASGGSYTTSNTAGSTVTFNFTGSTLTTIFSLGVAELGPLTGNGSGLLNMAIVGGAILPVIQGAIADRFGIHHAPFPPRFAR